MLAPWKKNSDQLRQHIQKQKHNFTNKSASSQSYGFSKHEKYHEKNHVWMWELNYEDSWGPKNCWVSTVMLEKTLESPLNCRRSNQSILKEIIPEYSLEELMLMLKFQYFGHLMQSSSSLEKTTMLGKMKAGGDGDDRGWDGWIASQTQWTWVWVNSGSWWRTGKPGVLQSMDFQRVRHDCATELNWTEILQRYIRC